ncbi:TrkA family potassium uptake protein [candidate division TA06 bacterium]|uniref:TrkA family potassium uptake protein n=1 Tax=candidate division TA06 bacterium TaxID=2250710 RepID=A0A523UNL4_UNCT6|nr:MAG: TrkA family potassium uptake protein [candidate division TA06 bacterium]
MRQFAVIGLGRFGSSVARTLVERGHEVLAIDSEEEKVAEIADQVTHAVQLDASDEKALRSVGVADVDVAVVSVGDISASILITLLLKELGVGLVASKALDALHAKVLRRVGADKIIFPERDMGVRVADSLSTPGIFDYIEVSPTHSIVELVAPGSLQSKTMRELDLRAKYGVNVIAIKRKKPKISKEGASEIEEEFILGPTADEQIVHGDLLVLLGKDEDIEKLKRL